MKECCQN